MPPHSRQPPRADASCACWASIRPLPAPQDYGVIEIDGSGARLMRFGAWKLPSSATFAVRLREIHFLISGIVQQFAPDAVAVESVFTALNVGTALKLAEMRGVVLLAAAQAQIPAHSYSPREVKANVTGFGGASKQQVQQMVRSLLGLAECPEPRTLPTPWPWRSATRRRRERASASPPPRPPPPSRLLEQRTAVSLRISLPRATMNSLRSA